MRRVGGGQKGTRHLGHQLLAIVFDTIDDLLEAYRVSSDKCSFYARQRRHTLTVGRHRHSQLIQRRL
jgi:hypothetical protein